MAQEFWERYRSACSSGRVSQLAVRYINRIDIPIAGSHVEVDMKDYFSTRPEISKGLPQLLAGFFMQLPVEDIIAKVVINQTIVPPHSDGILSFILDIDLCRDQSVPDEESQIWDYFEILRLRKDDIFESCITDATRELFK